MSYYLVNICIANLDKYSWMKIMCNYETDQEFPQ